MRHMSRTEPTAHDISRSSSSHSAHGEKTVALRSKVPAPGDPCGSSLSQGDGGTPVPIHTLGQLTGTRWVLRVVPGTGHCHHHQGCQSWVRRRREQEKKPFLSWNSPLRGLGRRRHRTPPSTARRFLTAVRPHVRSPVPHLL